MNIHEHQFPANNFHLSLYLQRSIQDLMTLCFYWLSAGFKLSKMRQSYKGLYSHLRLFVSSLQKNDELLFTSWFKHKTQFKLFLNLSLNISISLISLLFLSLLKQFPLKLFFLVAINYQFVWQLNNQFQLVENTGYPGKTWTLRIIILWILTKCLNCIFQPTHLCVIAATG